MLDWQAFGKQVSELPQILPREDEELTYWYEGTRLMKVSPKSTLTDLKTFEVRDDDLFLISYPKAGTTWMQEIISMVMHEGNEEDMNKTHVFYRFPFLEVSWVKHYSQTASSRRNLYFCLKILGAVCSGAYEEHSHNMRSQVDLIPPTYKLIEKMDSPRMIKTHLPEDLLPPGIHKHKPQVIYVGRNPKDCAVSFYHFHDFALTLQAYKTWDEFFKEFCDGKVYSGSWFDHTLYWWNKRRESNVLFMKYEDMKRDLKGAVKQTADFLGKKLTDDVVNLIADHCTFAKMKKNPSTNPDTLGISESKNDEETKPPSFMRKGQVGDWKNYFTVAQNDKFDQLYNTKLANTGLDFDFELQ